METQEKRRPHPKLMARHRLALNGLQALALELGRKPWSAETSEAFERVESYLRDLTTELMCRRDQLASVTEAYAGGLVPELAAELELEHERDTLPPSVEYNIQLLDRAGEPLFGASMPLGNDDAANDEARELAIEHAGTGLLRAVQARVYCKADGRTWLLEVSP